MSISVRYEPGQPPRVADLPQVVEAQTRRQIDCSTCGSQYAVYSATAYCPICGPRPAAEKVIDQIVAARGALALEDRLGHDQREELRAVGVLERFYVDAIESVVTLFELFAADQFARRVDDAAKLTTKRGNVFQRLDDAATLFGSHAGLDLVEIAGAERWARLKRTFAQRHVLVHRGGIVDARYVEQVPDTKLRAEQRIVITRQDAEAALDDLESLVRGLAAA